MFTQLLTTAAALLLLGSPVQADYIRWARLARTVNNATQVGGGISWGTVVVSARGNNGNITTGIVCDDSVNTNTADFLCRAAGFDGVESWGNQYQSSSPKISYAAWHQRFGGRFALDGLRCPEGAQQLDDCSRNSIGVHDCSFGEGVVLKCRTGEAQLELGNMAVQMLKGYGYASTNGTVVLNGTQTAGLVCADGVDQRTAEVLCNEAGFEYLLDYGAAKNVSSGDKLNCDTMQSRDVSVIADDLSCSSNATDLDDCSAFRADGTCDVDDALWLSCSNDGSQYWQLANLTLAYNEAGHHGEWDLMTGDDYGTVLVTVRNTRTGEERTGFTPYTSSSYTRSSLCYMTGNNNRYPVYRRTGWVSDAFNTKVSCGYVLENDMNFVLSYLWCPGYYQSLSNCNFKLADEDWSPGNDNAMWLNC